jgi:hypothetical protein
MAATQDSTLPPALNETGSLSDIEKGAESSHESSEDNVAPYVEQRQADEAKDTTSLWGKVAAFTIRLSQYGVETRG